MNEHDNSLEQLFARNEPDTESEEFVARLHQRVVKQRRITRAIAAGMYGAIALAAGTIIVSAPEVLSYPVQLTYNLLSSPVGAAASGLITVGLAWWSRFGEV